MTPPSEKAWRIAEKLGVNIFHTSPTAIRMLRKVGPTEPEKYNYRFKNMTTVGEPIEPEVWRWYYTEVGKGQAAITDTWWQTENGGFLGSTLPALEPMKPGSCGPGVLGIYPVIYDENGDELPKGSGKAGNICIRNPWPGMFQTIWGDPERFLSTYFRKYNKNPDSTDWRDWPYFTNDGAVQAADGYFRIIGRVDDVINVAGHRLGTKEIESAALTVPEVAEAAAVPVIDEVRGRIVELAAFGEDRLTLTTARRGPFAGRRLIDFQELAACNFVGLTSETAQQQHIAKYAARLGMRNNRRAAR